MYRSLDLSIATGRTTIREKRDTRANGSYYLLFNLGNLQDLEINLSLSAVKNKNKIKNCFKRRAIVKT